MGTGDLGDGSLPAGFRGRAPVGVWGKALRKPEMLIQSALDKRVFVIYSYERNMVYLQVLAESATPTLFL